MKVKDLIARLAVEDPEMRVVVDGYESGYDNIERVVLVNIEPNLHNNDNEKDDNWWDGEYIETMNKDAEIAVLLPRKS